MKTKSFPYILGLCVVSPTDIEALECELAYANATLAHFRGALNAIYNVLDDVEWTTDSCVEIAQILEHAGYTIHAPGEPEGLVHGDSAEGHE